MHNSTCHSFFVLWVESNMGDKLCSKRLPKEKVVVRHANFAYFTYETVSVDLLNGVEAS